MNEEAKRVFTFFKEICPSSNCRIFSRSSENYAKHLLYLKDQIKDIERNIGIDSHRYDLMEQKIRDITDTIDNTSEIREKIIQEEDQSSIIDAISEITSSIFKLQLEKNELDKIFLMEEKYIETSNKRELALDRYEGLGKKKQSIPRMEKIKNILKEKYIFWLNILKTPNINYNITFKDDFYPILGFETLEQLKGSTKVRAILAYRTAIIETMLELNISSFKFAIFDTPKQHEIHYEDLNNFIVNLKSISKKYDFQFIFSSTSYKYEPDKDDSLWMPQHPGEQHNMFLKKH